MSYILSALKKSEQDRQRGQVPSLSAPPVTVIELDKRPRFSWRSHPVIYTLLATFLLINGAWLVYVGGFYPQTSTLLQSRGPQAPTELAAKQNPVVVRDTQADARSAEQASAYQRRQHPPEALVIDRAGAGAGQAVTVVKPVARQPSAVPQVHPQSLQQGSMQALQQPAAPAAIKATAAAHADSELGHKAAPQQRLSAPPPAAKQLPSLTAYIPDITQLPPALKSQLPVMRLNGHIYAPTAAARRVIINGISMRENQYMSNDIRVKEIVAGGVVLDYRGQLFQLSLN